MLNGSGQIARIVVLAPIRGRQSERGRHPRPRSSHPPENSLRLVSCLPLRAKRGSANVSPSASRRRLLRFNHSDTLGPLADSASTTSNALRRCGLIPTGVQDQLELRVGCRLDQSLVIRAVGLRSCDEIGPADVRGWRDFGN